MKKILVLNSGSSSLKFQLFSLPDLTTLASGLIEQIGAAQSHAHLSCFDDNASEQSLNIREPIAEHRQGIMIMSRLLQESGAMTDIHDLAGIGHRVVHGGELFHEPVLIDDAVISAIEALIPLAPLHNLANLIGIRVAREHAAVIPQVAVFDTAFHQSIPDHGYLYALPYALYEKQKVRRYGFHGTSHGYVTKRAAQFFDRPLGELNIISLHLGSGASAAAVQGGKCIDTSMGLTPLEGLIMGTRSGDLDPAILFYLGRETGIEMDELDDLLNKQSGLKGICGENDMRTITEKAEQGDPHARLALTMFCYRLKKYIGAYIAALGGVDCIIFTGGIGENSDVVRQLTCEGLERLGIRIDLGKNSIRSKDIVAIHKENSPTAILVVPTDEELEIARQTLQVITQ